MTARDLAALVRSSGFTPAARDARGLIALLGSEDEELAEHAERAIGRLGAASLPAMIAEIEQAKSPLRGRLSRAIGRFAATSDEARAFAVRALTDVDAKTRRNAIVALGKAPGDGVEAALLEAWAREPRVDHRRSIAEALGKVGGLRARTLLDAVTTDDAELRRLVERARLMLSRTSTRSEASGIDASREPPGPTHVMLYCRDGIERILADEAGEHFEARAFGAGRVKATLRGPLAELAALRTATGFAFPLPQQRMAEGEDASFAIARALASPESKRVLTTWTRGRIRYRIAWADGGHKRAVVWSAAKRTTELDAELVNDPTDSVWEASVRFSNRFVDVELSPRALEDTRFAYRLTDVPAASHPTIAAALARIAGVDGHDVVWDPFVGSGTELIERAKLGPYARLIGTDVDEGALTATRTNLEAAKVDGVELHLEDATTFSPTGVTLILSNPPMGRRVVRSTELGKLLDRFVDHAAKVLVPGGRIVWLSPLPERTRARAEANELHVEDARMVDMRGFSAELQVLRSRRIIGHARTRAARP
jgi:23S rRNA G2445 N2-methylase RlmL